MNEARDLSYLRAQRSAVEQLLAGLDEEDELERIGLEARRSMLDQAILASEAHGMLVAMSGDPQGRAAATLTFGGGPVLESRAIEVSFGADALRTFQKLVSTTAATRGGRRLGARGRIPYERDSRLFVTGTVQGSFGFELEEASTEASGKPGFLRETVEEVGRLLEATRTSDEAFEGAVSESNPRVLSALAEFLDVLDVAAATLRLSAGRRQCVLDTPETTHATAERARRASMTEAEEELEGVLLGVLPVGRRFELRTEESGELINGRVAEGLEAEDALTSLVGERCRASLWVVTLTRAGKEQRAYYLTAIGLAPASSGS